MFSYRVEVLFLDIVAAIDMAGYNGHRLTEKANAFLSKVCKSEVYMHLLHVFSC